MEVLGLALDFIQGFVTLGEVIFTWLTTPIGIGDWSIRPIDAMLPAGITIFLAIVVIQIIRKAF
jgi:hypothetical protein